MPSPRAKHTVGLTSKTSFSNHVPSVPKQHHTCTGSWPRWALEWQAYGTEPKGSSEVHAQVADNLGLKCMPLWPLTPNQHLFTQWCTWGMPCCWHAIQRQPKWWLMETASACSTRRWESGQSRWMIWSWKCGIWWKGARSRRTGPPRRLWDRLRWILCWCWHTRGIRPWVSALLLRRQRAGWWMPLR